MRLYEEFAYLSTKNKYRYVMIMNIFLDESEKINMELTDDYIYREMIKKGYEREEDYTKQQLINDLLYLEENNNISIQEENLQNIQTLEEYKNRKKYYSITKKGAFVARNIQQYLLMTNKTSLCDEHFERLLKDINKCKRSCNKDDWNMFFEDAKTIFQIYQDFLAEFNGRKFEKIISTREFLIYKKEFQEQIDLLINKLSKYAGKIGKEMVNISIDDQRFLKVKKWFLYVDGEEPTYMNILHYCSILIEKITRKAKMFVTAGEENADYREALYRFLACNSLEDCEDLYLELYGYQAADHLNYSGPFEVKETEIKERIHSKMEIYDEEQKLIDEKKALDYLKKEIQKEEQIIGKTVENILRFDDLKDMDTEETLTVLSWLSKGMENMNKCSITETGRKYHIERKEDMETIEFETRYGKLTMPAIQLIFEGNEDE